MISLQLLIILMIVAAVIAIEAKEMITSVIAIGAVGLALSLSFLLLLAPDLAIVLLIVEVLTLTVLVRLSAATDTLKLSVFDRVMTYVLILFSGLFLIVGILALRELPHFGMPAARAMINYAGAAALTGSLNIVATVALDLRLYDTLAGIFVLFTAALGVRMIMQTDRGGKE